MFYWTSAGSLLVPVISAGSTIYVYSAQMMVHFPTSFPQFLHNHSCCPAPSPLKMNVVLFPGSLGGTQAGRDAGYMS